MKNEGLTLTNIKRDLGIDRGTDWLGAVFGGLLLAAAVYTGIVSFLIIGAAFGVQ